MLRKIRALIAHWVLDKWFHCGKDLVYDYHGYEHKWAHCNNCGWCEYLAYYTGREFHDEEDI